VQTKPRLLDRLRQIGTGPSDLDTRVRVAEQVIRDERPRFTLSAAGRIQWNWYLAQLTHDIGVERSQLVKNAGKRIRPGEPEPQRIIDLFDRLTPHIVGLMEGKEQAR